MGRMASHSAVDKGRQGGQAASGRHAGDQGHFGAAGKAGQRRNTALRNPCRGRQGNAQLTHRFESLNRRTQSRPADARRSGPQLIKPGTTTAFRHYQQLLQSLALFGRNAAPQQAPESGLDPAAQAHHEPFERAAPRQQNLVCQQPGGRTLEELAGPLGAGPAQAVEPTRQPKANPRFGEVAITVVLANFGDVFPPLLARLIRLQRVAVDLQAQLARECLHDLHR